MYVRIIAPVTVLLSIAAGGCHSSANPTLHTLSGTITRDGKPISEGGLIFIPESGGWGGLVMNANVEKDGSFTVESSRTTGTATDIRPGIPAGHYKAVYHPPSDGQKSGLEYQFPDIVIVEPGPNSIALSLPIVIPKRSGSLPPNGKSVATHKD